MPFPPQKPRRFTRENVEALRPNQFGCYGLFRRGEWIFVGAGDIRVELIKHLRGGVPCVLTAKPTHWVDTLTDDMHDEAARLIAELGPTCNEEPVDQ